MWLGGLFEWARVILIGELGTAEGRIGIADWCWVLGLVVHDAASLLIIF